MLATRSWPLCCVCPGVRGVPGGMSTTTIKTPEPGSGRTLPGGAVEGAAVQGSGVDKASRALITEAAQQASERLGPLADEHVRLVRHVLDNHQRQRRG